MVVQVSELFIYPIKSCGGISLTSALLAPGGLAGDRRYMLVDETGLFVSRRTEPRLALVSLACRAEGFAASAPGMAPLLLPHGAADDPASFGVEVPVHIWQDKTVARLHERGSEWFSQLLGEALRLVYLPDSALRPIHKPSALTTDRVSLADAYPLLLTSESSLDDLNARLPVGVSMTRFRPNIVVTGAPAFFEDTWAELMVDGVPFVAPKLCDRCVVTTIEEGTGLKGREPLRALATFRRFENKVWFGTNLIARGSGELHVGGLVTIAASKPSPFS